MQPVSLGVLCSFLIVIHGYRIREPAPVLEIVAQEFPLEEANVSVSTTENGTLDFDNFTITENCSCLDGDYTCWWFYLDSNEVAPTWCYFPYDDDDGPSMNSTEVPEPTNETSVIYNLTGPWIEMATLDLIDMDPDCWLLPLDSGRVPDCSFWRPKGDDSLMISNNTELSGGTVELYPPIGGPLNNELGFLNGQQGNVIGYPVDVPDLSSPNETLITGNVDSVDIHQLGSEFNETFPIIGCYFPGDSTILEIAFTEGLRPSILNETHPIALPETKPTMNYNQLIPRFPISPQTTDSKFHPAQTQDQIQHQHQINLANRIPTNGAILFKESKNPNKNRLAMTMDHPQTTQPPPPPSTPSLSTGGKKRKKTKTTVTTSTSTMPPTSTTKKGQRKRKVTKTTTASTTGVFTSRKKIKRTRTTVSADS
ncbi:uncharacterized protein LOC128092473 [Culex pipiens pallens]|uniref:uncharacterized protein LOC128092473 n=1 Tax=Culex pipiens pallens TaxID=42434 RepID=UPI0022AA3402|nr:uncharacterized protein LOC128092473 [Culex pipiens pallens]